MTTDANPTKPTRLQRWLTARKTLGWYTAEVLVIFLGITFSYLFDEWRSEKKERLAEAKLLRQFQTELTNKLEEIHGDAGDASIIELTSMLDSLSGRIISHEIHALVLPRQQYSMLNRNARNITAYFFSTTTPAFTSAGTGNLWPIMPDSVNQSLQEITQTLTISGNLYGRITIAANDFYRASIQDLVASHLRGDENTITLDSETCGYLIAWRNEMGSFTTGDDRAEPKFVEAQRLISKRLQELKLN